MKVILEVGVAPPGTSRVRQIPARPDLTLRGLLEDLAPEVPLIARALAASSDDGRPPLFILRNGQWTSPDDLLEESDEIEIHPPIAGGSDEARILAERRARDQAFASDPMSPLTEEQRARFTGLDWYPYDPAWRFELQIEPVDEAPVEIPVSGGGPAQVLVPAARLHLTIQDQDLTVTLYRQEHGGPLDYFLPFRDATAGTTTYGGGRYLDLQADRFGRVILDFNEAYNPHCAYNDLWACPLPPPENWLPVPVTAGERTFPAKEPGPG